MDVFRLRGQLIRQYSDYVRRFIQIRDKAIQAHVAQRLQEGMLWPEPLIQLNPSFEPGAWIDELVTGELLHPECARVFRIQPDAQDTGRKSAVPKNLKVECDAGLALGVVNLMPPELEALPKLIPYDELVEFCKVA